MAQETDNCQINNTGNTWMPVMHRLPLSLISITIIFVVGYLTNIGPIQRASDINYGVPLLRGGNDRGLYTLAYKDSGGFFDDIKDTDWNMLKERVHTTPECLHECEAQPAEIWFQNNWEPSLTCLHERRVGSWGDGGKWVCDPHRIPVVAQRTQKPCLVYSIGSNNDFSFEESILRDISPDCEIHTFDPTIGDNPGNLPAHGKIKFHPWGLGKMDDNKYKTLTTIQGELGHLQRGIDILKVDCEGCEWDTYKTWFAGMITLPRQIQIELHRGTEGPSPVQAMHFMRYLKHHGYVIFHKEPNTAGCKGVCIEFSFLRVEVFANH